MNDAFVYSLKLDVVCPSEDDISNILILFSSELNKSRDRSSYSVRRGNSSDTISFDVSSKDATALRASLNTITTNLQVYEKSRTFSSKNDLRNDEKFDE
jgi:tRNA threonylcarbamoyladenosine modification (KEOPS) complex  Pcc1 subunit